MVRVRASADGLVTGPGPGRGVWLGPAQECAELAAERRGVFGSLRAEANAADVARLLASWSTDPLACPHKSS